MHPSHLAVVYDCGKRDVMSPGLNLCRNKPDPASPKSDPAPHFVRSPSSRANERRLC